MSKTTTAAQGQALTPNFTAVDYSKVRAAARSVADPMQFFLAGALCCTLYVGTRPPR